MLDCNNEEGVCIIDKVKSIKQNKTISDELTVKCILETLCVLGVWDISF